MGLCIRFRGLVIALMAFGTVAWHAESMAGPILGANVIVNTTGHVTATYLGHTARISNDLYLNSPTNSFGLIFNNHATPIGTTFDLGTFTAGTELIFRLHAHESGGTDLTPRDYFTGAAGRNPDGIAHAYVDGQYALNATYVGFEDVFGGGDLDYDDLKFSFTNTRAETLPEPATFLLLGTGLGALALTRRLRRANAG
ncbi:MAG TPA: DUF4114 domain-containing protein [Candidatus Binatia bacterium]|jgi:hypothetical protein